jgi:hypothetical protein
MCADPWWAVVRPRWTDNRRFSKGIWICDS